MLRFPCASAAALCMVASVAGAQSAPRHADARENPLLEKSTLQFQAPPFDKIRDSDYQPAIERGMREQLVQMDSIANQGGRPTFDNTIVAMERTGALLTRASKIFFGLTTANTDDTLQKVQDILAPKSRRTATRFT